jgi:hypothetical protein
MIWKFPVNFPQNHLPLHIEDYDIFFNFLILRHVKVYQCMSYLRVLSILNQNRQKYVHGKYSKNVLNILTKKLRLLSYSTYIWFKFCFFIGI